MGTTGAGAGEPASCVMLLPAALEHLLSNAEAGVHSPGQHTMLSRAAATHPVAAMLLHERFGGDGRRVASRAAHGTARNADAEGVLSRQKRVWSKKGGLEFTWTVR